MNGRVADPPTFHTTLRPVIDPENVWTYLPMILMYVVSLLSLFVYRLGIFLHPWVAPGVVLLLAFYLFILGAVKVDDWWISRGGKLPTNILSSVKRDAAEKARRTIETYAPLTVFAVWLTYGLLFRNEPEMLVPELASNAASLIAFLLVTLTYIPALRRKTVVAVGTAVLILGISLFAPGPASVPSLANVLVSLHKLTAFSLLYLLTEMSDKLRSSPVRNGYSSSYVRKIVQTGWILYSGRFISLLAWVQVGWAIWVMRRRAFRSSSFLGGGGVAKAKTERDPPLLPTVNPAATAAGATPHHHHQSTALANGHYAGGSLPLPATVPQSSPSPGPLPSQQQQQHSQPPQTGQWPPTTIHSSPSATTTTSFPHRGGAGGGGGLSGTRRVYSSSSGMPAASSGRRSQGGHRRSPPRVARPGGSPLDRMGDL